MSAKKYAVCFHPDGEIHLHRSFLDAFPLTTHQHLFERLKERVRDLYRVFGIRSITLFAETGARCHEEILVVKAFVTTRAQNFTAHFIVHLVHFTHCAASVQEIDWIRARECLYPEGDRRRLAVC